MKIKSRKPVCLDQMALADAGSSQSNTNCAVITETDQDQHSANLPSKEDTNHAVVRETDKRNEKLKSESNTTPAVIRKTDQHNELEGGQDETNSGKPHNDREPDVKEEIADDNSRDGTSVTENNNPPEKLTTLADLIHVCRERGLQVFNDKPNHPEADKLWLKTRNGIVRGHRPSGFTPSPPAHGFRHEHQSVRSGHTRSTRSRHSRRSRRSKKSSRREETSGAHCPDSVSTAHVNYGTEVSYNDSDINSAYHKATASRSVRRGAQAGSSGRRSSAITRHDTLTVGSACHRHSTGSRRETLTRTSVLSILVSVFCLPPPPHYHHPHHHPPPHPPPPPPHRHHPPPHPHYHPHPLPFNHHHHPHHHYYPRRHHHYHHLLFLHHFLLCRHHNYHHSLAN